jgi:hypothetical protein
MDVIQVSVNIAASVVWAMLGLRLAGTVGSAAMLLLTAFQTTGVGLNVAALIGGLLANGGLGLARAERVRKSDLVFAGTAVGASLMAGPNYILYLVIAVLVFGALTSPSRRAWLVPSSRELRSARNRFFSAVAVSAFVFSRALWGVLIVIMIWFINRGRILLDRSKEAWAVMAGVFIGVALVFLSGYNLLTLPSWNQLVDTLSSAPFRLAQAFSANHPYSLGWGCLVGAGLALVLGMFGRAHDGYRTVLSSVGLTFLAGLSSDFTALRVMINLALSLALVRSRYSFLTIICLLPTLAAAILDVVPISF